LNCASGLRRSGPITSSPALVVRASQQGLAQLAPAWRDEVRAYAKDRLVALGWTPRQAA
jgi:hypothetical protein